MSINRGKLPLDCTAEASFAACARAPLAARAAAARARARCASCRSRSHVRKRSIRLEPRYLAAELLHARQQNQSADQQQSDVAHPQAHRLAAPCLRAPGRCRRSTAGSSRRSAAPRSTSRQRVRRVVAATRSAPRSAQTQNKPQGTRIDVASSTRASRQFGPESARKLAYGALVVLTCRACCGGTSPGDFDRPVALSKRRHRIMIGIVAIEIVRRSTLQVKL